MHSLGRHSITADILGKWSNIMDWVLHRIGYILSKDGLDDNISNGDVGILISISDEAKYITLFSRLLHGLVSIRCEFSNLGTELQLNIQNKILQLCKAHFYNKFEPGLLFTISSEDYIDKKHLEEAIDNSIWALGCLQFPLKSMKHNDIVSVIKLIQARIEETREPKTIGIMVRHIYLHYYY